MMHPYLVDLSEIDAGMLPAVGGKGANLGEIARIDGVRVPPGFCVTTEAYRAALRTDPEIPALIAELDGLAAHDAEAIARIGVRIRAAIGNAAFDGALAADIERTIDAMPADASGLFAVRSSATAEDLATRSFAGQQDTYLGVTAADVPGRVRECWASVFSDRAIAYRIRAGFEHRDVALSVVVQRMVSPRAAGIMFTADPLNGDRTVVSIDSGRGLGEALVSGLVNPNNHRVRAGSIVQRSITAQPFELRLSATGGVERQDVPPHERGAPALSDDEVLALAALARRVEAHFGRPQDIEWAIDADGPAVLQSRPITTLYPVPRADDDRNHVYISYGHRQMMTDAFRPLGSSFFELLHERLRRSCGTLTASRFYRDVSPELRNPWTRKVTLRSLDTVDALMADALRTVTARPGFMRGLATGRTGILDFGEAGALGVLRQYRELSRSADPGVVPELIAHTEATRDALRERLATAQGTALLDAIDDDHRILAELTFDPRSIAAALVGIQAVSWVNTHMRKWLGDDGAADPLARSAPHNIVAAMGLDLLDIADIVRAHPETRRYLEFAQGDSFFPGLERVSGGPEVSAALRAYLDRYGMHCAGDIDITRTRWSEDPSQLMPLLISNVDHLAPGERARRVTSGERAAADQRERLLGRLRALPGGAAKARRTEHRIRLIRAFIGYREYSKHALLERYAWYKDGLMREARRLVQRGAIAALDDIFFLTLPELRDTIVTGGSDPAMIEARRRQYADDAELDPPRVITSDGEVIPGTYRGSPPEGALPGVPISAGVVEGRARIVRSIDAAGLQPGDILIATFVDPSWSPLLAAASGVVMEIGGAMTHGAVVAREYGLPALVGVVGATTRIPDGARIRVDGTNGHVEILTELASPESLPPLG